VNNAIPREPGIVHDNVDLAVAELGGFFYEVGYIVAVEDVADDGEGAAGFCGVDCVGDGVGFRCFFY
jgi:hypothetical protein